MKKNFLKAVRESRILRRCLSGKLMGFAYGIYLAVYETVFCPPEHSAVHKVLIAWAAAVFLYDCVTEKRFFGIRGRRLLYGFTVSVFLSAFLNRETGITANLCSAVLVLLPLYCFLPLCFTAERTERFRRMLLILSGAELVFFLAAAASVVLFFAGYSETAVIHGAAHTLGIYYSDWGSSTVMLLYGVFINPNQAAVCSLFSLFYSAAVLQGGCPGLKQRQAGALRFLSMLNIPVQLLFFPLANSRGGWLALCGGILVALCFLSGKKAETAGKKILPVLKSAAGMLALCGGMLLVQYLLTPAAVPKTAIQEQESRITMLKQDEGSGSGRLIIWKEALNLYRNKPVFGEMPGTNAYFAKKTGLGGENMRMGKAIHNSYLDALLSFGFVGTGLLFAFFLVHLAKALRRFLESRKNEAAEILALSWIFSTLIAAMFLSCIFTTVTVMYYFLLVPAGAIICGEIGKEEALSHV